MIESPPSEDRGGFAQQLGSDSSQPGWDRIRGRRSDAAANVLWPGMQSTPVRVHRPLQSHRGQVLAALAAMLVVRVIYLAICPLELIPDEAYYWDWSRQLDWSYYSKPPAIAWLIALMTSVLGDSEFCIRLPAAVLGTGSLWVVYELGRRLYGHNVGFWAMLVVAASPGTTVACLLMTTDSPFLLAWTATVYCVWRMLESNEADVRWLAPATVAAGLGLLSKQTSLALFPLAALFLATGRSDRTKLVSPMFWTWVGGSLVCLGPVVWWNYRHDWITVGHTQAHFRIMTESPPRHMALFLEFIAGQFAVLPVFAMVLTASIVLIGRMARVDRRERFLLCFGGLPLLAVIGLSFTQRVQPNWPVALHLAGVVLLAAWGQGRISLSPGLDSRRWWLPAGLATSAFVSAIIGLAPLVLLNSGAAGTSIDLTARMRGWRRLADHVDVARDILPDRKNVLIVAATSRAPVSELAYYLPDQPRVYRWNPGEVVDSQHDVWGGPKDATGRDAIIVTEGDSSVPQPLAISFVHLEELDPVAISIGHHKTRKYRLWQGRQLLAWPEPSINRRDVAATLSDSMK